MKAQGRYWMTAIAFSLSFGPMTGFASESETAIEQPLQLQEQLVQCRSILVHRVNSLRFSKIRKAFHILYAT